MSLYAWIVGHILADIQCSSTVTLNTDKFSPKQWVLTRILSCISLFCNVNMKFDVREHELGLGTNNKKSLQAGNKQKGEAEAALQASKDRREGKGRQTTKKEKKALAAGVLVNKGPAAMAAGDVEYSTSPPATPLHPTAFSAAAALDQRRVCHGTVDTAAQLHVCKGTRVKGARILLKRITGDTVIALTWFERCRPDEGGPRSQVRDRHQERSHVW